MRLIRWFFLFLPNAKMKGTCESCAATVLLPGDLLAVLPASSQPEQQLKLLPAACCHVQQIRWEIKRTSVTTQRNQHFQSETLWLSFKWLLQDDTYHILKGPFPLYWSYWEPGETCSALSICFQLSALMFLPSESHEGPWNRVVHPTARCWKGDSAGGRVDPSPALRMCQRRAGHKVPPLPEARSSHHQWQHSVSPLTAIMSTPTHATTHRCTQDQEFQAWT